MRDLSEQEISEIAESAGHYHDLAAEYLTRQGEGIPG